MAKSPKVQLVIDGKDNTKEAFASVDKGLLGISTSAAKAGAAIAGAFAIATAGVVAKLVTDSIGAADNMRKLAQGAGVTTEKLSGLSWAASQSGVDLNALSAAMGRLNKGANEAQDGAGKYAETLSYLGISVANAEGGLKSADVLLAEIADKFQEFPDGAEKSAIAIELFGKSGAKLIPLLNAGSSGISDLTAQAERLGLVISDEQAAKSEQFNDTVASLGAVSKGTGNILAGELLPVMNEMSGLLLDFAEDGDTAREAAASLSVVIKGLAIGAVFVGAAFKATGSMIGAVGAAALMSATGDFKGAAFALKEGFSDYVTTTKEAMSRINTIIDGGYNTQNKQADDQKVKEKAQLSASRLVHEKYVSDIKAVRDQLIKDAEQHIKELSKTESKALAAIESAKKQQLATEVKYKDALAKLRGGSEGQGGTYSDASSLKVQAREQLQAGDIDGAKESAQAALDILLKIKAEGGNDYGFAGFALELQSIEQAADQIKLDGAQAEFDRLQQNIASVKLEAEALKNMPISVAIDGASLDSARTIIQSFASSISKDVSIPVRVQIATGEGQEPPAFAAGGRVRGPGSGTSDSILARLSNGEYVMRAAAVRKYGTNLLDNLNGLNVPKFSNGGAVGQVESMSPQAKSIGTLNFNLPGGDSFSVDVAGTSSLDDLHRAALKFGRTRS